MRTLVLDETTISIQVAMSTSAATINPTFVASFADHAGSGITEGASDGVLNGSTDVTVVGPPTGANRRIIKDITIFNGDTAPVTVLIKYDNNATQRTLVQVTLAIGDTYTTDGTFDANGNLKQSTTSGGDVVGPASATDNAITRFDATTGKLVQNSLVTIADNGAITAPDVGSVIPFYYPNQAAFPSAATYHGALAHSHADGAMFFAHGGVWIRLLDVATTVTVAQGGTGITSFGTGVATFLGTPSSANLAAAVTDETGSGALVFATSPTFVTPALGTPASGNLSNTTVDGTNAVGYLGIPSAGAAKTSDYTLAVGDKGELVEIGSGGSITVPASTFAAGDAIVIFNNNAGTSTITTSAPTVYVGGTNTIRTSVTLAARGICNVLFISPTLAVITGNVT